MRPTLRGLAVAAAVVLAYASASAFGPRGLNAVVAPGLVALAAAVVQVYRVDPPSVERWLPRRGERGSTVDVRLELQTDTPRSARVVDAVGDGLAAEGADRTLSLGTATLEYDLHLQERGERSVGPTTVEVRDVLGLFRRRFTVDERDSILVHPRVHRLAGGGREAVVGLTPGAAEARETFESLRRYQRGDPLRDVHWKSSARQPDGELVVRQFAAEEGETTVEVAAEAAPESADAMAEAAASVCVSLVGEGAAVGLTTPSGRVPPDDPGGRHALLDHLAAAESGTLQPTVRANADVHVAATVDGVEVSVAGRTFDFAELSGTVPAAVDPGETEAAP